MILFNINNLSALTEVVLSVAFNSINSIQYYSFQVLLYNTKYCYIIPII